MVQLEKLTLSITETDKGMGPGVWNTLFLGVSEQYAEALHSSPELWDAIHIDHRLLPSPSILNMSALKMLRLSTNYLPQTDDRRHISDVSFRFGFLRMPNLRELHFGMCFKASPEMGTKWEADGRIFNYSERSHLL